MKQRLNGDQQLAAHEPNWTLLMLPHRLQRRSRGSCLQRMCFLTCQKLLRPYKNMVVLLIVLIISVYPDLFLTWQSIFSSRADAGCPHLSDVMSSTEKSLWLLPEWWLKRALAFVAMDLLLVALDGWKRLAWHKWLSQTLSVQRLEGVQGLSFEIWKTSRWVKPSGVVSDLWLLSTLHQKYSLPFPPDQLSLLFRQEVRGFIEE